MSLACFYCLQMEVSSDYIRAMITYRICHAEPKVTNKYFANPQVMWLRQNADWASLLTLGNTTHISDSRYSVSFQYPNNWRLAISGVRREDHGVYVCQVNTHPPRMLITNVTVLGNAFENVSGRSIERNIRNHMFNFINTEIDRNVRQ